VNFLEVAREVTTPIWRRWIRFCHRLFEKVVGPDKTITFLIILGLNCSSASSLNVLKKWVIYGRRKGSKRLALRSDETRQCGVELFVRKRRLLGDFGQCKWWNEVIT
jgi:hypothetical protein